MTSDHQALLAWQEAALAHHFELTPTSMVIRGEPDYATWELVGVKLRQAQAAVHWWIGDWLRYGEKRWGETYAQALVETDYSYGTLANDKYVAERVQPSYRHENLSWSHHAMVAPLEPEEQAAWLDRAEAENMTRDELRYAIKASRNPGNPDPDPLVVMVRPIKGGVSVQCVRPEAGFTRDCFTLQEAREAFGTILEDEAGWAGRFRDKLKTTGGV